MTIATIQIRNLKPYNVSLDLKIDEDRTIRESLAPVGDTAGRDRVNVGDKATIDELNLNEGLRVLLDHVNPATGAADPIVALTMARGSADLPGAVDEVADADGLGGMQVLVKDFVDAGGAADHDTVLKAAMPYAARIVDSMVYLATNDAACTKGVLMDALAGAGTELSVDYDLTAVAGLQRHDGTYTAATDGTMPVIAAGAPLTFFRETSDASVGKVVVVLQRL